MTGSFGHEALAEHVGLKVGDPLLAVLGHPQVAQRVLHVGAHDVPIELVIVGPQVTGTFVSQLGVEPEFLELVKKSCALLKPVRVAQLPDEVRRPYQPAVALSVPVPFIIRQW
jgi:hypothetical protein